MNSAMVVAGQRAELKRAGREKLARSMDSGCAYCAERAEVIEEGIIGKDRKLYCSTQRAKCGEALSWSEMEGVTKVAMFSRYSVALDDFGLA